MNNNSLIESQRAFFHTGATLDLNFRRQMLQKLQAALDKWGQPLADALWTDLHNPTRRPTSPS